MFFVSKCDKIANMVSLTDKESIIGMALDIDVEEWSGPWWISAVRFFSCSCMGLTCRNQTRADDQIEVFLDICDFHKNDDPPSRVNIKIVKDY